MADRSTSAVDVAQDSGDAPLTAKADDATADEEAGTPEGGTAHEGARDSARDGEGDGEGDGEATRPAAPPELHSGHKLAKRYRLEECVTRLDGFSSWRAVDEKLRRAVGVHLLPAKHPRAAAVLAAARSTALLTDPRFVQVLDAVEENNLVYVVHEWLPDATELTTVLASGPLEAHDAYELVCQVSEAMAAAHRADLAHLRLNPGAVLRTSTGQYRVRGLAVNAALRGVTSNDPERTDTEAIGALLYASLTQRWPYEEDAYGLSGLPKGVGLIPPDQVRAGVHRGLSELAMRALVNKGATASRQEQPCTTAADLVKAVAEMPRVRPPEPTYAAPPEYQNTTYQQGSYGRPSAVPGAITPPPAPPAPLQSRTGRALKWGVSALLIVALGLGSWQLADALMEGDHGKQSHARSENQTTTEGTGKKAAAAVHPLQIAGAAEYYPDNRPQHPGDVGLTYDGKSDTYWRTKSFNDGPDMNPAFKQGLGIVYDLGSEKEISTASIGLRYQGDHTTITLYAADSLSSSAPLSSMDKIASTTTQGDTASLKVKKSVKSRYVVMWITAMPRSGPDEYSKPGYKQAITDVKFTG